MEEQDIKQKILKEASELFKKFGLRSISMDDIARHLRISKKTIYQYFSDKDEIITISLQQHLRSERTYLKSLKQEATDSIDFLIKLNYFVLRHINRVNTTVLFELHKYHTNAFNLITSFGKDFLLQIVLDNLKEGVSEGNYKEEYNLEVIARLRLNQCSMSLNDALYPRNQFKPEEVAREILDHFIAGIATEKGKRLYRKHKAKNEKLQLQFDNYL